ncbi:MAG: iron ABC transporter permease [Dehalococcoidales bacterium]|nr:iron ABC transporter permease [Dehalococcoidales bacterium]
MRLKKYILPVTFLVLLGIFVLYPTVSVLQKSFMVDGELNFGNYIDVFTKPHLYTTIGSSALVALGAALLSTLLGLIIAIVVFKTTAPLRKLFAVSAVLPIIIPGFVTTIAYIFLFGRNGVISYQLLGITWDVYSWKSVLMLQSLDLTTTAFLLISATMVTLDSRLEDAARSLGASEWNVFRTVTLPLLRPGIIAAALLTFMRSIADFGTPMIVGGSFDTLASASYTQLIGTYNMEMASTLNMILLIISVIAFWLYSRGQARLQNVHQQTEGNWGKEIRFSRPLKAVIWTVACVFSLIVLMMLVSVFLAAFTRHIGGDYSLTWAHFQILPQRGWNSTVNTIVFAVTTMVLVSFLGILIAYLVTRIQFRGKRLLDWLTTLPFAIPGTFMGVGFAIAFSRSPLLLAGTWMIVVACTVIRELPLGLRAGVSVLSQQDSSIEDAAASLGASKIVSFFNVIIPMSRSALVVTAAWAFIATVQTLGAIIFIITPGTKLLSVDVFEAVVRNDWGDAAAFSVVMLLLAAFGVLLIYSISRRQATESWFRRIIAGQNRV